MKLGVNYHTQQNPNSIENPNGKNMLPKEEREGVGSRGRVERRRAVEEKRGKGNKRGGKEVAEARWNSVI